MSITRPNAAMRVSKPNANRIPQTNSKDETKVAVACGAGNPRLAKNSVTCDRLCNFAQPFCESCQPHKRESATGREIAGWRPLSQIRRTGAESGCQLCSWSEALSSGLRLSKPRDLFIFRMFLPAVEAGQ